MNFLQKSLSLSLSLSASKKLRLKIRIADFIGTRFENDAEIQWDLENGYDPKSNEDAFPYRALDAGDMQSLVVTLADRIEDKQEICRNYVQGFKILFHTPGDDVQVLAKNYVSVPLDQSVSIAITPKVVTSDDLRHYTPEEYVNQSYENPKSREHKFLKSTKIPET